MGSYVLRRIAVGLIVLLGATFIVYQMVAFAADPLEFLRTSTAPNKAQQIAHVTEVLDLGTPAVLRYFKWLGGIAGYLWGHGTLGISVATNQPVTHILAGAVPTTVKLVFGSVILAILLGVAVGIVTALRQYSAFDYVTTFFTFLFYSLPAFWVAVLLKEFGAIKFNDFLARPHIPPGVVVGVAVVAALIAVMVAGGRWRNRALAGGVAGVAVGLVGWYVAASGWLSHPGLGIVGIGLTGVGVAVAVVAVTVGLGNRRVLVTALAVAVLGIVGYVPLQYVFVHASGLVIVLLAVVAVGCGIGLGALLGGRDRRAAARTGAIVALVIGALTFADRVLQAWPAYLSSPRVAGRPIATIGAVTPGLGGSFWFHTMDVATHLLLPTISLVLISFASYTRYTRSSMLEVMNQDYIRTARAKGLSERTVVMRHAFRNALIPLATVVPIDLAAVFGGAIITERVFSWQGMGTMFLQALKAGDPNTVLGYFLVTAVLAIGASIVADVFYAWLDPRIRVAV
ncbi:MAG: ABC transporter permease [Bifidobacteriaceae bacterium]|jgi:peptide/nickel transport system permease protein|nr:ABC transporter permease [Bifidobacteriaceae bacterium]